MEDTGAAGPMPGGTAAINMFDHFIQAIDRIALGLSQQNAQMYQDFQQHIVAPQPAREFQLEGVTMPTFSVKPSESVDEFIFRAKLLMEGKCIDYTAASNHSRVVAILAANLREGAASWYHAQVVIDHVRFADIESLADALRREFVPPDQQFRLRAELKTCRQRGSVEEYMRDFRRLIAQIRQMSPVDQVDRFCDGLKSETRKEVMYLRCSTLAEAIAAAQAFERTHFQSSTDRGRSGHASQRRPAHRAVNDGPTPMAISAVDTRSINKEQCRRQNLCFYCKQGNHRISDCPRRKQPQNSGQQGNKQARRA